MPRQEQNEPVSAVFRARLIPRLKIFALSKFLLLGTVALIVVLALTSLAQVSQMSARIDDLGRQRMLSQRIVFLANEWAGAEVADIQSDTALELGTAIGHFAETHHTVLSADNLSSQVSQIYFAGDDGPSLNEDVAAYITHANRVLADPADSESLARLIAIERGGLVRDLDRVVAAYKSGVAATISALLRWEIVLVMFIGVLLAVQALFVFRPGYLLLQASLLRLEQENGALVKAQATLNKRNQTLKDQHEILQNEREDLQRALAESEALRREQAEFAYSVSHDLKSPANTMLLLLNELELDHGAALAEDGNALLQMMQGAVRRMTDLIEDVLQYSWATDRRTDPDDLDMAALVAAVIADLTSDIRERDAVIRTGVLTGFFGFEEQVRILVQNLIANGLKFQAEGTRPEIDISCIPLGSGGGVQLRVTDNGIGIAPEDHDRIFGLFQRLHLRDAYDGTGLGLATCKRIAANHSGDISVTSTPNKGTTFLVTLRHPIDRAVAVGLAG